MKVETHSFLHSLNLPILFGICILSLGMAFASDQAKASMKHPEAKHGCQTHHEIEITPNH